MVTIAGITAAGPLTSASGAPNAEAGRHGYAKVTDIRDIDRTRYGYRVKGRLTVQDNYNRGNRGYNSRYNRYDRGYGNNYNRSYDKGKFTCYVERGRVVDINFRGLRGY